MVAGIGSTNWTSVMMLSFMPLAAAFTLVSVTPVRPSLEGSMPWLERQILGGYPNESPKRSKALANPRILVATFASSNDGLWASNINGWIVPG
jgi:hypothetical protein